MKDTTKKTGQNMTPNDAAQRKQENVKEKHGTRGETMGGMAERSKRREKTQEGQTEKQQRGQESKAQGAKRIQEQAKGRRRQGEMDRKDTEHESDRRRKEKDRKDTKGRREKGRWGKEQQNQAHTHPMQATWAKKTGNHCKNEKID